MMGIRKNKNFIFNFFFKHTPFFPFLCAKRQPRWGLWGRATPPPHHGEIMVNDRILLRMAQLAPGVLCNYGYRINSSNYTPEIIKEVCRDLHVVPVVKETYAGTQQDEKSIRIFLQNGENYYLPRFYGRKKFGEECGDYLGDDAVEIDEDVSFNKEQFKFSERQKAIANASLKGLYELGGGIIRAGTGAGKTVISLYCALKMRLRTLIIVPRVDLRKQWMDEATIALPGATFGVLESPDRLRSLRDCDFIFATMHCYSGHKWPMDFLKTIGMIIIDEVHLVATPSFSKCFLHYCPKYILALSATSLRVDRQDVIVNYFCGESLYSDNFQHKNDIFAIIVHWSNKLHNKAAVQAYNSGYDYGKVHLQAYNGKPRPDHSRMLLDVIDNPIRNKKIADLAIRLAKGITIVDKHGRHVLARYRTLVVSTRLDHLKTLQRIITRDSDVTNGLLIGGMKESESKESKGKQILLGNLSCVRDGLSIMDLDALIVTVSVKNTLIEDSEGNRSEAWKQLLGRILRREHGKPIFVYYIADTYGHFRGHTTSVIDFLKRNEMVRVFPRKLTRETQDIPVYSVMKQTIPMLFDVEESSEEESGDGIDW
jgi:superfamily II DNA or RNA helicase